MLTLEQKAARHRKIKSIANKLNKKRAADLLRRRREAEYQRDLKSKGVDCE